MAKGVTTVIESCFWAESGVDAESVTFTVNVEAPAAVGVPEIFPEPLRLRPAGRDEPDATLHVSVPVPPVAASVAL
jgi:hypothetical protein